MPKQKQVAGLFVRNPNFVKAEEFDDEEVDSNQSDSGVSEDISSKKQNVSKKRKIKSKNDNKTKKLKSKDEQMSVEEINELKETEDLYHSNLFRMQIDETLKEVQMKADQQEFISKWLKTFKKFLEKLPTEEISDRGAIKLKPVDGSKKVQVSYKAPENVTLYGSHALETNIEAKSTVDVLLVLPADFLFRSDYINQIYCHKRALYLSHVAKKLKEKGTLGGNIKFVNFKNDPLKPAIQLEAEDLTIVISAVPNENFFKLNRFIPETNNIKLKDEEQPATPHNNFSLLFDCTIEKNQKFLENEIKNHNNVKNAIKLLKIWLHQREFDSGFYPLNGFLVTCYLVHLLKIKKIYPTMSCYQILRLFWNQFGNSELNVRGISLCSEEGLPNQPSVEDFFNYYDVVMVDSSGYCNLFSFLSVDLYKRIRDECLSAIKLLNDKTINSFYQLFLIKIPSYLQYDQIITIKMDDRVYESIAQRHATADDKINYYNMNYALFRKLVLDVLRKGLTERISFMAPLSNDQSTELSVGIKFNPENAFNIVEKGPQSNNPEAEDFRKFWGNKAEIRRFKDGSITESVLWCTANAPTAEKRLICEKIVTFLLKHHFNIGKEKVGIAGSQFEVVIRNIFNEMNETNEERSLIAVRAFDELSKELRNLNDLPLEIVGVYGIDSTLRYTDPTPPLAIASSTKNGFITKELKGKFLAQKVINGILQLAPSGKWPDEIDAMKRIKAAFYVEISKRMAAQFPSTVIGVKSDCVEILKNKHLFRLKIVHPKEIAIAKEMISTSNNLTKLYKTNDESLKLEFESSLLPKLTSFLHGLHHRYPSYGPTVATAKRWLYSQMIDNYLWPDECTELIIAEMYLKNYPMEPPASPQTGFLRFLTYLSTFSSDTEMIVVNFNDELDSDQISTLENQFRKSRKNYPPLFIVTSIDLAHHHGIWSSRAPSVNILKRVQMLAECSIQVISDDCTRLSNNIVKDLFTPSMEGYDLVIHLNDKFVKRHDIVLHNFVNFKAIQYERKSAPPADVNFVANFLSELRSAFDDVALFFYNPIAGTKIAMLWKPTINETRAFAISHVNRCRLIENGRLKVNVDAIIKDIQIIGKGIITSVEILK